MNSWMIGQIKSSDKTPSERAAPHVSGDLSVASERFGGKAGFAALIAIAFETGSTASLRAERGAERRVRYIGDLDAVCAPTPGVIFPD